MSNPITEQILGAWDEDEEAPDQESEGTESVATGPDPDEDLNEAPSDEVVEEEEAPSDEEEEAPEEPGEEAEDEEEPSEEESEEEPQGEDEAQVDDSFSDDPKTQAFLTRHGGTVESAIKAAMQFETVLGRQGRELGQLRQRTQDLEAELEQTQVFAQSGAYFDEGQRQWLEEAVGSENPVAYLQSAVQAGEYGLARSVLEQVEMPAYQALRFAQAIDQAEARSAPVEQEAPLDHQALLGVLVEHYPEMPQFEAEMVQTLASLGPDHPLAALARSQDPGEAAQGLVGLYEIARARTATVASARDGVTKKRRQAADAARRGAVVSSTQATPSQEQAPRPRTIMPGLTLEALDAEFQNE